MKLKKVTFHTLTAVQALTQNAAQMTTEDGERTDWGHVGQYLQKRFLDNGILSDSSWEHLSADDIRQLRLLCHPDLHSGNRKDVAHKLFCKLNQVVDKT